MVHTPVSVKDESLYISISSVLRVCAVDRLPLQVSITTLNALGASDPSSPLLSGSTLAAPVPVNR
eukprot:2738240-Rhodomonas_salina.1